MTTLTQSTKRKLSLLQSQFGAIWGRSKNFLVFTPTPNTTATLLFGSGLIGLFSLQKKPTAT